MRKCLLQIFVFIALLVPSLILTNNVLATCSGFEADCDPCDCSTLGCNGTQICYGQDNRRSCEVSQTCNPEVNNNSCNCGAPYDNTDYHFIDCATGARCIGSYGDGCNYCATPICNYDASPSNFICWVDIDETIEGIRSCSTINGGDWDAICSDCGTCSLPPTAIPIPTSTPGGPTVTPGGPTSTPAPTPTPGGPALTPTPTLTPTPAPRCYASYTLDPPQPEAPDTNVAVSAVVDLYNNPPTDCQAFYQDFNPYLTPAPTPVCRPAASPVNNTLTFTCNVNSGTIVPAYHKLLVKIGCTNPISCGPSDWQYVTRNKTSYMLIFGDVHINQ